MKEWNTDELEAYASLVSKGSPDFIEIKVCVHIMLICVITFRFCNMLSFIPSQGVTYCGESKASNLTLANVPWHEEVNKHTLPSVPYHPSSYYSKSLTISTF